MATATPIKPKFTINLSLATKIITVSNIVELWSKYISDLEEFKPEYNYDEINDIDLSSIISDKITIEGHPKYEPKGVNKQIEKIIIGDKSYAFYMINAKNMKMLTELETHLQILILYYRTKCVSNWQFKIPRLYRNIKYPMLIIMDFVKISDKPELGIGITNAKSIYLYPIPLRQNYGKFIGLMCKYYNKLIYDEEIYYEADSDIPYILDFGETQLLSELLTSPIRKQLDREIYKKAIEIFPTLNNYVGIFDYTPPHTGGKLSYDKYMKYKNKYLLLKQSLF